MFVRRLVHQYTVTFVKINLTATCIIYNLLINSPKKYKKKAEGCQAHPEGRTYSIKNTGYISLYFSKMYYVHNFDIYKDILAKFARHLPSFI